MLQAFLRMIGISQGNTPGVAGAPVAVDGDFGAKTKRAVERLKSRDQLSGNDVVDDSTLGKIKNHWTDYFKAYESYSTSQSITITHTGYSGWIAGASTALSSTYNNQIQQSVDPNTTREEILTAWINKEAGTYGHWGHGTNFRITLGSADEYGSIGFSQILNMHKYGSYPHNAIKSLNLYHPNDGVKGFAVFSNDDTIPGGGGFKRAFVAPYPFKITTNYTNNSYPRMANSYTDDNKDLLSKGIMAYNSGPNNNAINSYAWPDILRIYDPPVATTDWGTRTAIKYTLTIQNNAQVPLKSWNWSARRIVAGANGICESTVAGDDILVNQQAGTQHVCISPGSNGVIDSNVSSDDQLNVFQFNYSEEEWLNSTSTWTAKMLGAAVSN